LAHGADEFSITRPRRPFFKLETTGGQFTALHPVQQAPHALDPCKLSNLAVKAKKVHGDLKIGLTATRPGINNHAVGIQAAHQVLRQHLFQVLLQVPRPAIEFSQLDLIGVRARDDLRPVKDVRHG